jgi:AcrR family transcriptional regulator
MLATVRVLPPKRVPRQVREQQMVEAAIAVFAEYGFHAASMDEIAARSGITKPMVYAYLGTKEELFLTCLHREATRLMEAIAGAAEPDLPADEQLWRGLRAFFGYVLEHRDGWLVLHRKATGHERFAAELAMMRVRIVEVVTVLLARMIVAGGRRPRAADLSPMAYALVGACESMADWAVDQGDEPAEVTATRLMNFVWTGAAQLLRGSTWRPNPEMTFFDTETPG